MIGKPILSRFDWLQYRSRPRQVNLHTAWLYPSQLPSFVHHSAVVQRYLDLLGSLAWDRLPERNLQRNWGQPTIPYAAFIAACLIKLNENKISMGDLCLFMHERPELIWLLGFPLSISNHGHWGYDVEASLPTARHLTRMLRETPNFVLQFLLADSVRLIGEALAAQETLIGECISLDTKHILAWVKENNPRAYVEKRYDKNKQPSGDPDCKLGCKRTHNRREKQALGQDASAALATPYTNPRPAGHFKPGEFYWGYSSGVVVSKVPGWGEVVIAELTQTFDQADISYFFPLMAQTEARLGFRPRYGTFDAAYDAWYVYDYFYRADDPAAFAAVPFSEKGGYKAKGRQFSPEGLPLCQAGLPMPLYFTYQDTTVSLIPHERGKYVCPLRFPAQSAEVCPVNHKNWAKKGCTAMMPTSIGARLRYTLDRDSQVYKDIYKQRTAVERINSQAKSLGIERPHIRNGAAIANQNTLIYILINLRLLQRIRHRQIEAI